MGLLVEDSSSQLQTPARLNGIERANETIAYGITEYGWGGVWTFSIAAIIVATHCAGRLQRWVAGRPPGAARSRPQSRCQAVCARPRFPYVCKWADLRLLAAAPFVGVGEQTSGDTEQAESCRAQGAARAGARAGLAVSVPERAAVYGLKNVANGGKGNCLPEAIALLMNGTAAGHAAVRDILADELLCRTSEFEARLKHRSVVNQTPSAPHLQGISSVQGAVVLLDNKAASFPEYVNAVRKSGTNCGFPELMAFAYSSRRSFPAVTDRSSAPFVYEIVPTDLTVEESGLPILALGFNAGDEIGHWEALVMDENAVVVEAVEILEKAPYVLHKRADRHAGACLPLNSRRPCSPLSPPRICSITPAFVRR